MDVSLIVDNGRPWPEIRELAETADGLGAYAVYVCDHFMGHTDDDAVSDDGMLESMTLLGALIVFAPQALYVSSGETAANICGFTGEEDQIVGATMMLAAGATIYLIGGLRLVAAILMDAPETDASVSHPGS